MNFLKHILKDVRPFAIEHEPNRDFQRVRLFIDQNENDVNARRISGVQLNYTAHGSTKSYDLYLEPAQNIDALVQMVENTGLGADLQPKRICVKARWKRMSERALDLSGLPVAGEDIGAWRAKHYHYSSVVKPYLELENPEITNGATGKPFIYKDCGRPVIERLSKAHFISDQTLKAISGAIEQLDATPARTRFDIAAMEKQLTDILGNGRSGKPIGGHSRMQSSQGRS